MTDKPSTPASGDLRLRELAASWPHEFGRYVVIGGEQPHLKSCKRCQLESALSAQEGRAANQSQVTTGIGNKFTCHESSSGTQSARVQPVLRGDCLPEVAQAVELVKTRLIERAKTCNVIVGGEDIEALKTVLTALQSRVAAQKRADEILEAACKEIEIALTDPNLKDINAGAFVDAFSHIALPFAIRRVVALKGRFAAPALVSELIEEAGVLLAEEEISCGMKHQKTFAKLTELRAALLSAARPKD